MEDNEIVAALFRRDASALMQLQDKYGPRLHTLALRFLKSREDAEEAVNDAYLRTWSTIPPRQPEHLFAYVARLCRYAALRSEERRVGKEC